MPVACIILFPVGSAVVLHDKGPGFRDLNVLHISGYAVQNHDC